VVDGRETEIMGGRELVGEGEGDRVPSLVLEVFTSLLKKLGAIVDWMFQAEKRWTYIRAEIVAGALIIEIEGDTRYTL
jgi:hypothetical protein